MNQAMNDAELCRKNGWGPGTYLAGDDGSGETVIEITAIGERAILCKMISHGGEPMQRKWEAIWTLEYRDWREIQKPSDQMCGKPRTLGLGKIARTMKRFLLDKV
jgi:hypothetical protein